MGIDISNFSKAQNDPAEQIGGVVLGTDGKVVPRVFQIVVTPGGTTPALTYTLDYNLSE